MTKSYFQQLATYNCWANQQVREWIAALDDSQWQQPLVSSFNSIAATVSHMLSAENIWLQRFRQEENPVWLPADDPRSKSVITAELVKVSGDLEAFIAQLDEADFSGILEYKRMNGTPFRTPYYEVLAHLFNHSTYHRGQLVTLLRQVGFTGVSSTDMVHYFRHH